MTEFEETVVMANRLLDVPNADPDDELRMLSRQFLRQVEKVERLTKVVEKLKGDLVAQQDPMGDLIQANRDEILRKHEEAVRLIRGCLKKALEGEFSAGPWRGNVHTAISVLDALNLFHPMHAESWRGWPKGSR